MQQPNARGGRLPVATGTAAIASLSGRGYEVALQALSAGSTACCSAISAAGCLQPLAALAQSDPTLSGQHGASVGLAAAVLRIIGVSSEANRAAVAAACAAAELEALRV